MLEIGFCLNFVIVRKTISDFDLDILDCIGWTKSFLVVPNDNDGNCCWHFFFLSCISMRVWHRVFEMVVIFVTPEAGPFSEMGSLAAGMIVSTLATNGQGGPPAKVKIGVSLEFDGIWPQWSWQKRQNVIQNSSLNQQNDGHKMRLPKLHTNAIDQPGKKQPHSDAWERQNIPRSQHYPSRGRDPLNNNVMETSSLYFTLIMAIYHINCQQKYICSPWKCFG